MNIFEKLDLRHVTRILILLLCAGGTSGMWASENHKLVRIGTGGLSGTYYPVGRTISALINGTSNCTDSVGCPLKNVLAIAQLSSGSVANLDDLHQGRLELALAQADITYTHTSDRYRLIMALYPEAMHIVTSRQSSIESPADLRGKSVSVDEAGSGTQETAYSVMGAYGMDIGDIKTAFYKPQFAAEKLLAGELDAFFIVAGFPTPSVSALALRLPIKLVPVTLRYTKHLVAAFPYLTASTISDNTYKNVPAASTVGVEAYLLAHDSLDPDLVFALTELLWRKESRAALSVTHPPIGEYSLVQAVENKGIKLHEGALRYYSSQGIDRE